jgi:hypothetical protein
MIQITFEKEIQPLQGRKTMQKIWYWVKVWRPLWLAAMVGMVCLAVVSLGQAAPQGQGQGPGEAAKAAATKAAPAKPGPGLCRVGEKCNTPATPEPAPGQTKPKSASAPKAKQQ